MNEMCTKFKISIKPFIKAFVDCQLIFSIFEWRCHRQRVYSLFGIGWGVFEINIPDLSFFFLFYQNRLTK